MFVNALLRLDEVVAKSEKSEPALKFVGANLRRVRDSRGLTQEKLAELSDVHYRTIQKVEGGEMLMRISTLFRLRAALKCRWEDLLGR